MGLVWGPHFENNRAGVRHPYVVIGNSPAYQKHVPQTGSLSDPSHEGLMVSEFIKYLLIVLSRGCYLWKAIPKPFLPHSPQLDVAAVHPLKAQ